RSPILQLEDQGRCGRRSPPTTSSCSASATCCGCSASSASGGSPPARGRWRAVSDNGLRAMTAERALHRNPVAWLAGLVALLIVVVAGGAWYAAHVLRQLPHAAAEQGRTLVREIGGLVRGFRTGTVQRRFAAYTTSLQGTTYLQVATLKQVQSFELEDRSAVFWGTVELPPVVVRATAPVDYTYFVDLHGTWELKLREPVPGQRAG